MNYLRQQALYYADKGWPIFPVMAGEKRPQIDRWQDRATTDYNTIEGWWDEWPDANIGFIPGLVDMMVLDLDPGHDMKELEANVGHIPETALYQTTPRGGSHLFYEIGSHETVAPSASKLSPNVDVRSHNSYVLLHPSVTEAGTYEWAGSGEPSYRTDEMVRVAGAHREKNEERDVWLIAPDLPENIKLAEQWLKYSAKHSVEGQGGDSLAIATANQLVGFGISEGMIPELLQLHWNQQCSPPWSYEELMTKAERAYRYHQSPPGNLTPAWQEAKRLNMFTAVEPVDTVSASEGREWGQGKFRMVDWAGMKDIKPPSWLLENFIPDGSYAMIFAPPASFKTFVALDIALTVATGYAVNTAHKAVTSGPVLYLTSEGRSSIYQRARAWSAVHFSGQSVADFYLGDPVPGIDTDAVDHVIASAKRANSREYKLIVLDTVARSMQGQDENSSQGATMFTAMVERLQRELGGPAVLVVHHTGKELGKGPRGSSAFMGDLDVAYSCIPTPDRQQVALKQTKLKDGTPWTGPQYVRLEERLVEVGLDPTLVCVPGSQPVDAVDDVEPGVLLKRSQDHVDVLDILEKVALDVLASAPGKVWKHGHLCEAVEMDDRVEVDNPETIRKYVRKIRSDSERNLGKRYDTIKSQYVG